MKKTLKFSLISFFILSFVTIILMLSIGIHTKDLKPGKYYLNGDINAASFIEITKDEKIKFTGFSFDDYYKDNEEHLEFLYSHIGDYKNLDEYFSNYLEYMVFKRHNVLYVPISPDGTMERAILIYIEISYKDRALIFGDGFYKYVNVEAVK